MVTKDRVATFEFLLVNLLAPSLPPSFKTSTQALKARKAAIQGGGRVRPFPAVDDAGTGSGSVSCWKVELKRRRNQEIRPFPLPPPSLNPDSNATQLTSPSCFRSIVFSFFLSVNTHRSLPLNDGGGDAFVLSLFLLLLLLLPSHSHTHNATPARGGEGRKTKNRTLRTPSSLPYRLPDPFISRR